MASIYKRNNTPYWYFALSKGELELLGKKHDYSTKEKSRRQAEIKLKELKHSLYIAKRKGVGILATTERYPKEMYEMMRVDRESIGKPYSIRTSTIYDKAISLFAEAIEPKPIIDYTRQDFYLFSDYLIIKGYSIASMSSYTSCINAIFNFAIREDFIKKNPMKRINNTLKPIKILTDEELAAFLDYAKTKDYYNYDKFMLLSAFRASEALAVRWSDVKANSIVVVRKGGKETSIPIINEMRELLDNLPKGKDRIFNHTYRNIAKHFERASKKLGFKIKSHDMRKYCLSKLANSGVNIFFVKNYAGHSDIKTTLRYYTAADEQKMAEEIDKKVQFHTP